MLPQAPSVSATRAPPEHVKPPADAAPAGSAVTVVPRRESRWQKQWQDMRSQARPSLHPHVSPPVLSGTALVLSGAFAACVIGCPVEMQPWPTAAPFVHCLLSTCGSKRVSCELIA